MRHVRPHEWADAERGQVSERRMMRMAAHAAACERCAAERARVLGALGAFDDIRATEAPALRWEHIGARIYWATSSERRAREARASGRGRGARRRWPLVAAPLALAAAFALFWLAYGGRPAPASERASRSLAEPGSTVAGNTAEQIESAPARGSDSLAAAALPRPLPRPLIGLITYLEGSVTRGGQVLQMHEDIVQGDRIAVTEGALAIQFGKAESLTLLAGSTLELAAFDERTVELVLDGEVVIDLSHRRPEQRFVVRAGSHRVVVRGTVFSVARRAGAVRVVCARGEVEVSDASGRPISVATGQSLAWRGRTLERSDASDLELSELTRRVFRVPTWGEVRALRETTATLEVMAASGQAVQVDGQWAGTGSFALRVMPGRHLVSSANGAGAWRDVEAGQRLQARVMPPEPAQDAQGAGRSRAPRQEAHRRRRAELSDALGHGARFHGCVSALRKQDLLDGAFIELDLGVLADGTINHLNIMATNLQPASAQCIRDVVDRIDFPPGPAVSLRHRIEW